MKLSANGLRLIAEFEGFRGRAYPDAATPPVWTIGFGHTGGVRSGQVVSRARAFQLLRKDVATAEGAVNQLVHVGINQHRFDALVSFVFNVGTGNFRSSTLLKKLNRGDYKGAAGEFDRWVTAGNGPLPGLVSRRNVEQKLFNS